MSSPSVSFSYGDANDAYYGSFSESGFSVGGGDVATVPEAAPSTVRVPPVAIAVGGALALVLIMLALSKKA